MSQSRIQFVQLANMRAIGYYLGIGCLLVWTPQVALSDEVFEAGIDYKVLIHDAEAAPIKDVASDSVKSIKVVEYFSYGCKFCMRFEEDIKTWLPSKPEDVEFRREAVVFTDTWAVLAKIYYVAVELGVLDKIHDSVFNAVHTEKLELNNRKVIAQLFEDATEVDPDDFFPVWDDEDKTVLNQIVAAHEFVVSKALTRTPSIVVNDRYLVTMRTANSRHRIFRVVNYLIEKVRKELQSEDSNSES